MAGLVATFVFAGQMMNFPVAGGTSGHLLGGALAAVLVGPWTAVLCVSTVLLVQGLFMAYGVITALGTNITLMGLVGVGVGWGVFVLVRAVLPNRLGSIAPAAAIGALVSVPVAALAFTLLFAVGGTAPVSVEKVAFAMVTWHVLIGIGEALPPPRPPGRRDEHAPVLRRFPARRTPDRRGGELLRQQAPRRAHLRRGEVRLRRQGEAVTDVGQPVGGLLDQGHRERPGQRWRRRGRRLPAGAGPRRWTLLGGARPRGARR